MSAAPPPAAVTLAAREGASCPRCGAGLDPEQGWCLRCGAAARTRVARTPAWRVPVAVVAVIVAACVVALAWAFVALTSDQGATPAQPAGGQGQTAPASP